MDIFLQVQTKEDDLETDFYDDLIALEDNNKHQEALGSSQATGSFSCTDFLFLKEKSAAPHTSAFKQAIQASHKTVIKVFLDLFNFS